MNNKRPYGKAFATTVQRTPFKPFPQNTTPMVLYRTPSQFKSLTNPRQGRIWPEKKNVDLEGSVGNLSSGTWSEIELLNGIANGNSASSRIGRKIQLKSLLFRWIQSSSAGNQPIRIVIVYDKQADGVLPGIEEILQGGPTPTFNSPMNLANADRFVILADEMSTATAQNGIRADKIYRKINLPQTFNASTAGIIDVTSGAIYVLSCVGNGVAGAGVGYYSRIRYTDV